MRGCLISFVYIWLCLYVVGILMICGVRLGGGWNAALGDYVCWFVQNLFFHWLSLECSYEMWR